MIRLGAILGIAMLVVACSTTPPVPLAPGQAADWLGGEPRVIVRMNTHDVSAWSSLVKSHPDLQALGGRTKVVWAGFDLDSLDGWRDAASGVRLVLEGDFPQGLANFALGWDSRWKAEPIKNLWTNKKLDMTIDLVQDGLVAARRHHTEAFDQGDHVLRGLDPSAVEASSLWLTFWSPGEVLFGPEAGRLLPVDRLDLTLGATKDTLEGQVALRFFDERAARAAGVLLKLLSPAIRQRFGQTLTWTVDGISVVGTGLKWKQDDVRALAETLVAGALPTGGSS